MTITDVVKDLQNRKDKFCILASSTPAGSPSAALMGYAIENDGSVILSTHTTTKKYKKLKENNKVALVFGWGFDEANVQLEGAARLVESGDEYGACGDFFFIQNPVAAKFKTEDTVFIKITPNWVRYSNFSSSPPKVEEIAL